MTRRIRLTNGRYTFVSDHRYEELRKYSWLELGIGGYIYRREYHGYRENIQKYTQTYMQRQIMGLSVSDLINVDHINGIKRDNRDENLRLATDSQNGANRKISSHNTTGYKGVKWRDDYQSYYAYIKVNDKWLHLGAFDDPVIAAHCYDNAARKYFGKFARTNFKDVMSDADILRGKRTRNSPHRR